MARRSIRRRDSGRWSIRHDLPPDPLTGKRRQRRETIAGTKREVEQLLARRMAEVARGIDLEPEKVTLTQYLHRWLTDHVDQQLVRSTASSYRAQIRMHIIPTLGGTVLTKLQPAQL